MNLRMNQLSTFCFPTTILFGAGAMKKLPEELQARGVRRPLVVTDRGLARMPLFEEIHALLGRAFQNVLDGVARYRAEGCDGVVGVGGGPSGRGPEQISAHLPPFLAVQ